MKMKMRVTVVIFMVEINEGREGKKNKMKRRELMGIS